MMNDFDSFQRIGEDFLPGNKTQLKLAFMALMLNRNVLIEDVPGMGKTTLVKFFSKISGLHFGRIQFTSDLLPSDIIGISVFHKETEKFHFKAGPLFGELILADELNRGTPKTQSALLEALEEKHVTVDGATYPLPDRFCLFATQNPRGQFGTYPLPESQLDRFLFKFSMGQLTKTEEVNLLATGSRLSQLDSLKPMFTKDDLRAWEKEARGVSASKLLLEYIADLLAQTRSKENVFGLSPRAGLDLLDGARAWAYLDKRSHVLPDDVQAVFPYVAGHRLFAGQVLPVVTEQLKARELLRDVPIVREK